MGIVRARRALGAAVVCALLLTGCLRLDLLPAKPIPTPELTLAEAKAEAGR